MTKETQIAELVAPVLNDMGYDIVRIMLIGVLGAKNSLRLQVMIERLDNQPITVDDCAAASKAMSAHLDAMDPIQDSYVLEVSSPGIDRPLTRLKDWTTYAGHPLKLELHAPLDGRKRFTGHSEGASGETIRFISDDVGPITFKFADIAKARLLIIDDKPKTKPKKEKK